MSATPPPGSPPDGQEPDDGRPPGPGDAVIGRVTDPAVLDRASSIALLSVRVPTSWSSRRVRIALPRNLRCRACSGGGCDRCGRSGGFRVPEGESGRTLELTVPVLSRSATAVRVPRPFDDASSLEQLLVQFEEGEGDPRVQLLEADLALPPAPAAVPQGWLWAGVAAAIALVALLARLLGG